MAQRVLLALALLLLLMLERRQRAERRYWVHPRLMQRRERGHFATLYPELLQNPEQFFDYCRMTIPVFNALLDMVRAYLRRTDTRMRQAICPEQRLLLTLRFLATGHSYSSLSVQFRLGTSTVSGIVKHTCEVLWRVLQPRYMAVPNQAKWEEILAMFSERVNFPNCFGALGVKEIRLVRSGGSDYGDDIFSLVLLALVDADFRFTYVEVGSFGSPTDSFVFQNTHFYQSLRANRLHLPNPRPWPGTSSPSYPCVLVASEAFGLSDHIMQPYTEQDLSAAQKMFNHRLSRAQSMVENTIGLLANKWNVLHSVMRLSPVNATDVVKASCVLHNYVRDAEGYQSEHLLKHDMAGVYCQPPAGTATATNNRDSLAQFFLTPQGQVPWQEMFI
ncbi:uncharacterized protein [Hyperolius riggenbachi]|uniref:uncharacterized protein n=1 Tax=Hyperolius riggenbachi TaxID=752182 RepID=UPI0035A34CBF